MAGKEKGFTLIEVLLAILVGSLVLTSVYGIFTSVSNARNRLEVEGEVYHQVRIFYDRIGGELRSLRASAGSSLSVLQAGKTAEGEPYLEFTTELVSPLLKTGGLSRVRYELRRDEEELATLFRSERSLQADVTSEALPFIAGLKSFEVRYLNSGNWRTSWSNRSQPQMVEVSLEIEAGEQALPFRSSFVLPRS